MLGPCKDKGHREGVMNKSKASLVSSVRETGNPWAKLPLKSHSFLATPRCVCVSTYAVPPADHAVSKLHPGMRVAPQ